MSEKAAGAQTRREFLKKSAALGTGAAVGVAPGRLGAGRLEGQAQDVEWDREADVVVVGAGAGGMAAAIAARTGSYIITMPGPPPYGRSSTRR